MIEEAHLFQMNGPSVYFKDQFIGNDESGRRTFLIDKGIVNNSILTVKD